MKPRTKLETKQDKLVPGGEVEDIIREATRQVEEELKLEDEGWISLGLRAGEVVTGAERIENLQLSRLYYTKDPLGKQAIRLWTDYTFGTGLTWDIEDEPAKKVLEGFWDSRANKAVLSARGQRKSSDKLLVDGEIFFAIFLGAKGDSKIRRIDPLQIVEIITDEDDAEDIRYYRRRWSDSASTPHEAIYRDITNLKDIGAKGSDGKIARKTDDALIYHLAINTTGQRGNPLLLPALDWIKQYRRFLASRIAIMLALARFAWKTKVSGGQTAVEAIKAKTDDQVIKAGSQLIENLGADTTPIKTESGARNAYDDGRMIKLQICAGVGIPEQYFGDISIGNLATAKTVELPLQKMFESYQGVWAGGYKDINEVILEHNNITEDKWYVDLDFPKIAPADVISAATALGQILTVMPELAYSPDIRQIAMLVLGVNDPAEALEQLEKESVKKGNIDARLVKVLRELKESLKRKEQ